MVPAAPLLELDGTARIPPLRNAATAISFGPTANAEPSTRLLRPTRRRKKPRFATRLTISRSMVPAAPLLELDGTARIPPLRNAATAISFGLTANAEPSTRLLRPTRRRKHLRYATRLTISRSMVPAAPLLELDGTARIPPLRNA